MRDLVFEMKLYDIGDKMSNYDRFDPIGKNSIHHTREDLNNTQLRICVVNVSS